MKQKTILVIALLALVSMMIAPVCAETLIGTLGGSYTQSNSYSKPYTGAGSSPSYYLSINSTEYVVGTSALVHFDTPSHISIYAAGAPSSLANIPFVITTGGSVKARGNFGFQRYFDIFGMCGKTKAPLGIFSGGGLFLHCCQWHGFRVKAFKNTF